MKKRMKVWLVGMLMLGATGAVCAQSSDDFVLSEDGTALIKYNGPGGRVVIPDGVKVIRKMAFGSDDNINTTMTEVVMPESLTTIEGIAFWYCTALESVNFSEGVTTIGTNAFLQCSALKSVTIPNSVTSLGDWAFSDCTSLTEAIVGDGVTATSGVFSGCTALKTLVMGTGIKSLNRLPFSDTTNPQYGILRSSLETLIIRSPQPPTIGYKDTLPANLPSIRTLHIREGSEDLWMADDNGWKEWATEIRADIFTVRDTLYADTLYIDTLYADTLYADTLYRDTLYRDTLYADTLTLHDTLAIHDTTFINGADTLVLHDTTYLTNTITVHDTLYMDGTDTLVLHDTLRIILHDTFIEVREIHDTVDREVYVVINESTSAETIVGNNPDIFAVAAPAFGDDMYYIHGITPGKEFTVHTTRGILIYRGTTQPVRLSANVIFIVGQAGKYYKFTK